MNRCTGLFPHTWNGRKCGACRTRTESRNFLVALGGLLIQVGEWLIHKFEGGEEI